MSHRTEEKQERREARLRAEEKARHDEARQRLRRRGGYGAMAAIALGLVVYAVAGGGGTTGPAGHESMGGAAGPGPAVGQKAPPFALQDVVSGRQVSSESLRGTKTVMFFSEGVNCQACLVQVADLEKAGVLAANRIKLVSVSTDPPEQLATAARQYGITTPMLADPTTGMSAAYGMLGHGGMGHPTQDGHAFILLDKDGKVLWHEAYQEMYVKPDRLLRDMQAALKA